MPLLWIFQHLRDMLGFGLSLLGGCAATTAEGAPDLLYFPTHSVRTRKVATTEAFPLSVAPTAENMASAEHNGLFIAENLEKTGARVSSRAWGFWSLEVTSANTLLLSLTGKINNRLSEHATNICISRNPPKDIGAQESLYTSGAELRSPEFILSLEQGVCHVTDSFSGEKATTSAIVDNICVRDLPVLLCFWGTTPQIEFDFVISAYRNSKLGANQLTQPMRTQPPGFENSDEAVFEFQHQQLIEL